VEDEEADCGEGGLALLEAKTKACEVHGQTRRANPKPEAPRRNGTLKENIVRRSKQLYYRLHAMMIASKRMLADLANGPSRAR